MVLLDKMESDRNNEEVKSLGNKPLESINIMTFAYDKSFMNRNGYYLNKDDHLISQISDPKTTNQFYLTRMLD